MESARPAKVSQAKRQIRKKNCTKERKREMKKEKKERDRKYCRKESRKKLTRSTVKQGRNGENVFK